MEMPREFHKWHARKKSNHEVCERLKNRWRQMISTTGAAGSAERETRRHVVLPVGPTAPGLELEKSLKCKRQVKSKMDMFPEENKRI